MTVIHETPPELLSNERYMPATLMNLRYNSGMRFTALADILLLKFKHVMKYIAIIFAEPYATYLKY